MFSLIGLSIFFAVMIVFIIWLFSVCLFNTDFSDYTPFALIATIVISVIVSATSVFSVNDMFINRFINSWNANKAIYESSTDITKILTNIEDITEKNRQLLDYQSDQKHWYGFHIPAEIQDLEPIHIGVSANE